MKSLSDLAGYFNHPIVNKLRMVSRVKPNTADRIKLAKPVIAEFVLWLDGTINSELFPAALTSARALNKTVPTTESVRNRWKDTRQKLRKLPDGKPSPFFVYVANVLPEIANDYSAANIFDLVKDKRMIALVMGEMKNGR